MPSIEKKKIRSVVPPPCNLGWPLVKLYSLIPKFLFKSGSFFLLIALVSCTQLGKIQRPAPVSSLVAVEIEKSKPQKVEENQAQSSSVSEAHDPPAEAYLHTLLGMQFESLRRRGVPQENEKKALREFIIALRYDPESPFLLERVARLYSRLGNRKDALSYAEKARELDPNNGELLVLLGDIYMAGRAPDQSLDAYNQALSLVDKKRDVYLKMAGAYAGGGDLQRAEFAIRKAIEVGPPSAFSFYSLGTVLLEKKDFEAAILFFRNALELDPYYERAHMGIANIYERQKDLKAAMNVYRQVVDRINPRNRAALNRLVQLLLQENALDDALLLLKRVGRQDPSNLDIPLQKSRIYAGKRNFPAAIDALKPVVAVRKGDVPLRVFLGSLYEANEQVDKALKTYESILEKNPSEYDVRIRLASLYFYKLKKVPEALKQADFAAKIDPVRAQSYLFRGLVLHELKRFDEAVEIFLMGIERNAIVPDLHFHLGATYDKLQRFEAMVGALEKAIALDPNHANALNYLGYTLADKGIRLDEAIALVNRALVVRPEDGYFIDSLAWAYFRQGKLENALDLLKKAVTIVPEDPVIHEHLGDVYFEYNQSDLARASWTKSLQLEPENDGLRTRFKQAGFALPASEPGTDVPETNFQGRQ